MNDDLNDLRRSLDNIDNALLYLIAERFRLTHRVGIYKRDNKLSPVDPQREAQQFKRIQATASRLGLDETVAHNLFRGLIDEVVEQHKKLQAKDS